MSGPTHKKDFMDYIHNDQISFLQVIQDTALAHFQKSQNIIKKVDKPGSIFITDFEKAFVEVRLALLNPELTTWVNVLCHNQYVE